MSKVSQHTNQRWFNFFHGNKGRTTVEEVGQASGA